jgi:RNA polymerase sigma-70 factor, ECF subfamily
MIQAHIESTPASVAQLRSPARQATSDEALIERIAVGDKLAMQALFARHRIRAFHFVLRMVKDHGLAEDVISETFLDVWRQASRFEARSAVGTWILTIARCKAISALRRRPRQQTLDEAAEIEDPGEGPEVSVQKMNRGEVLRKFLAALSRDHREIIDLVYYHEQPIEAVAEIVGIPASTVKTRMFYARRRLAELFSAAGLDRASL